MEYQCMYNPELDTVEGATHGKADAAQFLEMLNQVVALCGREKTANILLDHSDLDAGTLTMENIETLGRQAASKKDICMVRKCAQVVTNDLQYGLVRAWQIMVEMYDLTELETRLFKNRDEAVAWINEGV